MIGEEKSVQHNYLELLLRNSTSLNNVICYRLQLVVKQNYYMMNWNKIHNPVLHFVVKKCEKSRLTNIQGKWIWIFQ